MYQSAHRKHPAVALTGRYPRILLGLSLLVGLGGCLGSDSSSGGGNIGGGGGGGGGNGNGNILAEPTPVDGLAGDADNQDLLYFASAVDGNQGLFAVDPAFPEDPPQVVDGEAVVGQKNGIQEFFHPIHQASIGNDDTISNYRVDRVFYFTTSSSDFGEGEIATAATDANSMPVAPRRVSSHTMPGIISFPRLLQYDVTDADNTLFAYLTGQGFEQIRLDDDDTTDPQPLPDDHRLVAPVPDMDNLTPGGWLAVNTGSDDRMVQVDIDMTVVGDVLDDQGQPVTDLQSVDMLGSNLPDTSRYMVLGRDTGDEVVYDLWRFVQSATGPGTLHPVSDGNGERLEFSMSLFGGANVPSSSRIRTDGDAVYYIQSEGFLIADGAALVRLEDNGFEVLHAETDLGELADFLLLVDGRLVWNWQGTDSDSLQSISTGGEDIQVLDGNAGGDDMATPVFQSRDGWIYYNRGNNSQVAVANDVNAASRLEINNARWIGASSTGRSAVLGLNTDFELGEVFFLRDNGELGAVSAADPTTGYVSLGTLSGAVDTVTVSGLAPGPHRLMQVHYAGDPDTYEVIYVNTREPDSLHAVSSQPHEDPSTRPVPMF